MERFGNGGSIILVASMSGSITNKVFLSFRHDLSIYRQQPRRSAPAVSCAASLAEM